MSRMSFELLARDGAARRGRLSFPRGDVDTPAFMPVGTQGAVKGVTHRDLESLGAEILLSNTYHLYLRPGDDLIARRGGLHAFTGWPKPIARNPAADSSRSASKVPPCTMPNSAASLPSCARLLRSAQRSDSSIEVRAWSSVAG